MRLLSHKKEIIGDMRSILPINNHSLGFIDLFKHTPLYLEEFGLILEQHFCRYLTKEWFLGLSENEVQLIDLHFNFLA